MPDLASLYIKVDSSGVVTASKDLNKLTSDSQKTEKATEAVTAGFNKLKAVVIALGGAYAAMKMVQYIREATMLAARYETLGVVMRVVGNNAGYSGAQMNVFAGGLQKAGIAMVESRNTLARMIQAQISLTASQKLARIAQDAAVIGNLNSSQSFEQMIHGLQTGMPRILRTIGLNVDFNASEIALAASLGKKRDALSEAEVMQGRVNAVIKAGILIEGSYEGAMETAGKQVLSLTRHLDNLKVLLGAVFTPALAETIETITGNIKDLNSELEKNEERWTDWGNRIRLAIIVAKVEFKEFLQDFSEADKIFAALGMLATGPIELLEKLKSGFTEGSPEFRYFADTWINATADIEKSNAEIDKLKTTFGELVFAMSPAGKALAKAAADALEKARLAAKSSVEVAETTTEEQLKIQADFTKAYKKSILTVQEFETDSLNVQVEAFRAAKVNEVQLEEWMQNEIKNIKLRAQNELLALYEELAVNDDFYAQKAIDTMSVILDAEEEKWAKILQSDDDAHRLRIQKEEAYRDKVLGTIDDIVEAQQEAFRQVGGGGGTTAPISRPSSGGGGGFSGGTYDTIGGVVFINNRSGALAYAQELKDIKENVARLAEAAMAEATQAAQQAAEQLAEDAIRAAEEEAARLVDIAKQKRDLEIEYMEATGDAAGALAVKRADELAAMDSTLRPLQSLIWLTEDLATAMNDAISVAVSAVDDQLSLAKSAARAYRQTADEYRNIIDALTKAQTKISGGGVAGAQSRLSDVFALAITGDRTALAALPGSIDEMLAVSLDTSKTAEDYARDQGKALIQLEQAKALSILAVDWEEYQATLMESQISVLEEIRDNLINPEGPDTELLREQLATLQLIKDTSASGSFYTEEQLKAFQPTWSAQEASLTNILGASQATVEAINALTVLTAQIEELPAPPPVVAPPPVEPPPVTPPVYQPPTVIGHYETTPAYKHEGSGHYDFHGDWYWDILPGTWFPAKGYDLYSDGTKVYFAKGGVFDMGNVIPFATGGVFDSPTTFPMANGGTGMLGEAGPEAIMPLTRIGGKLGVKSMGADSPELLAEVRALRAEVKAGNLAIARSTAKTAKVLTDFDYNGMPAEREIN